MRSIISPPQSVAVSPCGLKRDRRGKGKRAGDGGVIRIQPPLEAGVGAVEIGDGGECLFRAFGYGHLLVGAQILYDGFERDTVLRVRRKFHRGGQTDRRALFFQHDSALRKISGRERDAFFIRAHPILDDIPQRLLDAGEQPFRLFIEGVEDTGRSFIPIVDLQFAGSFHFYIIDICIIAVDHGILAVRKVVRRYRTGIKAAVAGKGNGSDGLLSPDGKTDGEPEAVLLRIRFHRGDEIFQLLLRGGFAFLVALFAFVALFSLVALFVVLSAFPFILRLRRACSKKCEARERERDKQTQKYPFFSCFPPYKDDLYPDYIILLAELQ